MDQLEYFEYVPDVDPRGLSTKFRKKYPKLNDVPIKNEKLYEILSLFDYKTTLKKCSHYSGLIPIKDDIQEDIIQSLPTSDLKSLPIVNEREVYVYSKNKYTLKIEQTFSFVVYFEDEFEFESNIVHLIISNNYKDFIEIEDYNMFSSNIHDIILGICYGYKKEYIRGYYITKKKSLNLFNCLNGYNPSRDQKNFLNKELEVFENSQDYKLLSEEFEDKYSQSLSIIDNLRNNKKFNTYIKNNRKEVTIFAPNYYKV
jgi:hypothetical protein